MRKVLSGLLVVAIALTLACVKEGGYLDDRAITIKVKAALGKDDEIKARRINVEVRNGVVILIGRVDSRRDLDRAILIAKGVNGVKEVRSELYVDVGDDRERRTPKKIFSDSKITTKIKKRLAMDKKVGASTINVKTREGVVYLTGSVGGDAELQRVLKIVSKVPGVEEVANNLQIISDGDIQPPSEKPKHPKGKVRKPPAKKKVGPKAKGIDVKIARSVARKLSTAKGLDASRISVSSLNQVVTLSGNVNSKKARLKAARIARNIRGVKQVINKLKIKKAAPIKKKKIEKKKIKKKKVEEKKVEKKPKKKKLRERLKIKKKKEKKAEKKGKKKKKKNDDD